MVLDVFKAVISFNYYTELLKKSGKYTVFYGLAVWFMLAAGMSTVAVHYLGGAVPKAIKSLPSIEIKDGALILNDGQDYRLQIPGAKLYISYEPQREFPPLSDEMSAKNNAVILTKNDIYVNQGSSVYSEIIPTTLNLAKTTGGDFYKESGSAIMTTAVISVIIAAFLTAELTILLWVAGSLFIGFMLQGFMLKKLPKYSLIKLAVFVQAPVLVLFIINYFLPRPLPLFNVAQLCLSGIYIQQVLNHFPKLTPGDFNNVNKG